jgi:hypothetical protein
MTPGGLLRVNTYFYTLATCFGYVIAILRPTLTVELALDAALSGMKYLLFASVIKLTKIVLKHNYFHFNDNIYIQTEGLAMGPPPQQHSPKYTYNIWNTRPSSMHYCNTK